MNALGNNRGISLVEMLVSSTIALVLGGAVYTVFMMYNNQSKSSIASLLMHQQYDNVARQIAKDVRTASFVLGASETPHNHAAGPDTVTSIYMCDANGIAFAHYAIIGTDLTEGPQQSGFQAGGSTVTVVSGVSHFILDPQRRSVGINLTLSRENSGPLCIVSARKELFLCRNRS